MFDDLQSRCRYLAQVAKTDVMRNALNAAANKIDMLESKWISVNDRIPEIIEGQGCSKNVWAWDGDKLFIAAYCEMKGDDGKFGVWANAYGEIWGNAEWDDEYNVTHWQDILIPGAPKS